MLNKVHSFLPPLHLKCLAGWQQGVQTENVFHCPLAQKQNCYAGGVCWKFSFLLATPAPKCFPRPACPETELQQGIGAKMFFPACYPWWGSVREVTLPACYPWWWSVCEMIFPACYPWWGSVYEKFLPACYPGVGVSVKWSCLPPTPGRGMSVKWSCLPATPGGGVSLKSVAQRDGSNFLLTTQPISLCFSLSLSLSLAFVLRIRQSCEIF